ncbi:MAG: outer membrane protein transport protein [Candidatus Dactylopiibacterium sp.]|nr:outer membrane protein transport protein [Candidatus Dactylopiibacterium sp.]
MTRTMISHSIALIGGLALAQGASASGFQLLEQNSTGLGNAYAGSAVQAENASVLYFNPAAMTELREREVSLGAALIQPSFKFRDDGSNVAPATRGSNGGDAGGLSALPNTYFTYALNRDWYLGLGINAPFGLATVYDQDWVGRFHSIEFDIKTYNVNPAVAWRVNERLSLGAGVNWQRMEAQYERMAAVAGPLPGLTPAVQNTRVTLDATSEGWGWNAGAQFKLTEATRLGLSYRSAVKHDLSGTLKSSNQLVSPDVLAKASIKLPDTWIASASHRIGNWELLGDVSRTGWGKIGSIDILRDSGAQAGSTAQVLHADFRDTWRVALGASQTLNDKWKLRYGIAWDQSPVRSDASRLTSLPDNDRLWLTLGAGYALDRDSRIDVGAGYLFIKDTKIDNDQTAEGRGRVTGTYEGSVAILGVQYSRSF